MEKFDTQAPCDPPFSQGRVGFLSETAEVSFDSLLLLA